MDQKASSSIKFFFTWMGIIIVVINIVDVTGQHHPLSRVVLRQVKSKDRSTDAKRNLLLQRMMMYPTLINIEF